MRWPEQNPEPSDYKNPVHYFFNHEWEKNPDRQPVGDYFDGVIIDEPDLDPTSILYQEIQAAKAAVVAEGKWCWYHRYWPRLTRAESKEPVQETEESCEPTESSESPIAPTTPSEEAVTSSTPPTFSRVVLAVACVQRSLKARTTPKSLPTTTTITTLESRPQVSKSVFTESATQTGSDTEKVADSEDEAPRKPMKRRVLARRERATKAETTADSSDEEEVAEPAKRGRKPKSPTPAETKPVDASEASDENSSGTSSDESSEGEEAEEKTPSKEVEPEINIVPTRRPAKKDVAEEEEKKEQEEPVPAQPEPVEEEIIKMEIEPVELVEPEAEKKEEESVPEVEEMEVEADLAQESTEKGSCFALSVGVPKMPKTNCAKVDEEKEADQSAKEKDGGAATDASAEKADDGGQVEIEIDVELGAKDEKEDDSTVSIEKGWQ